MNSYSNVDHGSQEFTNASPLTPLLERLQRRGNRTGRARRAFRSRRV